jgi:hypothetical protein
VNETWHDFNPELEIYSAPAQFIIQLQLRAAAPENRGPGRGSGGVRSRAGPTVWWGALPRDIMTLCRTIFERCSAALLMGLLAGSCLFAAGCASRNVNPPVARAHTGYVDFYTDTDEELSWFVKELDVADPAGEVLFSEVKPLPGNILRLALPPGHYAFSIAFLNRIVLERAQLTVDVNDGQVTPVHVTLAESGTATVKSKETRAGGTYYGRFGRRTKFRSEEDPAYRVVAEARTAVPYAAKAQMPYYTTKLAEEPAGP